MDILAYKIEQLITGSKATSELARRLANQGPLRNNFGARLPAALRELTKRCIFKERGSQMTSRLCWVH